MDKWNHYQLLADIIWYFGHILSGVSVIINHYDFNIGIAVVILGQFIIIISRPIGRIKVKELAADDTV